jgi:hypothetical protein
MANPANPYCCELCTAIERMQATLNQMQTPADDSVISKVGRVTARVAAGKMGEVRLDTLEVNDPALIVGVFPPRTLIVRPAPSVASETASAAPRRLQA